MPFLNPSFEDPITPDVAVEVGGWDIMSWGGLFDTPLDTFARTTAWASDGTHSLHLKTPVDDDETDVSPINPDTWVDASTTGSGAFPVVPGTDYTLSADFNVLHGDVNGGGFLMIRWYNSSFTFITLHTSDNAVLGVSTVALTHVVPVGAVWAVPCVAVYSAFGDYFETYVDNFSSDGITPPPPPPPPPPPTVVSFPRETKASLELGVEVVNAAGVATIWDSNARSAGDIPRGITYNTKRGDGFSDGPQVTLSRRIDRDWADINLYDDFRLIGADGSIAYEGYIASSPRTFDGAHSVGVTVAGPMTHARRRPFSEVFVSRDMSQWQDITTQRQAGLASGGFSLGVIGVSVDGTGLSWQVPPQLLLNGTDSEVEFSAPTNVQIAKMMYRGQRVGDWSSFEAPTLYSQDVLDLAGSDTTSLTLDNTIRTATLATVRRYLMLRALTTGSTTPASGLLQSYDLLALYGNHTAPTRPVSGDADGIYASDAIIDICRRFVPKLNPSGVQGTSYPIQHLVFEQAQPYDAWTAINGFHLLELAVWENSVLHYYPADLNDYDWQVNLTDPGVTVNLPGDSTETLANGIVVSYLDIVTGRVEILDPDNTPLLADPNPLNPATLHGETAWTTLDLSGIPMSDQDAAQLGMAALNEFNQPKAAGTITVRGHIRDRAGHWQPGWKVRASDTVAIVDHPNDRPRLIGETTWDHDNKQLTIAVDSTLVRMDAILDRFTTSLKAAGLA